MLRGSRAGQQQKKTVPGDREGTWLSADGATCAAAAQPRRGLGHSIDMPQTPHPTKSLESEALPAAGTASASELLPAVTAAPSDNGNPKYLLCQSLDNQV